MALVVETLFKSYSDRVKDVDIHPEQQLIIASLRSGELQKWNYKTEKLVQKIQVSSEPTRACKFIARQNWIVTGSDDKKIRIFHAETLEKLREFEAHTDYIRSLAVHPTLPYVLSAGDDRIINVWDWENEWRLEQSFQGHTNYVMNIALNPSDPDMFATASLDHTIKLWRIGEEKEQSTINGHRMGVNCVHFDNSSMLFSGSDEPHLNVWNWSDKFLIRTLLPHKKNITSTRYSGTCLITASEDGTAVFQNCNGPENEKVCDFEMGRVWCMEFKKETELMDTVVFGTDSGIVVMELINLHEP